jgi:hypothetical protein
VDLKDETLHLTNSRRGQQAEAVAINPDRRAECLPSAFQGGQGPAIRERECRGSFRYRDAWAGPDEIFSVAAGLVWRPAPICGAAQTVMPDAVPPPQSGGEEPPIRSLIPVGLAALSGPDPAADS